MRLINTRTHRFEEFIGQKIPDYAILSHTWEEDEVSYQQYNALVADVDSSANTSSFATLLRQVRQRELEQDDVQGLNTVPLSDYNDVKGIRKIEMTCKLALAVDLNYAWIDTCCIDKSSSAELTEAINSMYRWYKRSAICFAYLSDLISLDKYDDHDPRKREYANLDTRLQGCRWFTRGWTLQELIAPRRLFFYNEEWGEIGSKQMLLGTLSAITRIPEDVLAGDRKLSSICVAQKMSWAARRTTTRTEDQAYCLLGIFDVNIPLLYGEEEKAFRRLQEEIVRTSTDMSIYAWEWARPQNESLLIDLQDRCFSGIMADSPLRFERCTETRRLHSHKPLEISLSINGIKMSVPKLLRPMSNGRGYRYILPLFCESRGKLCGIEMRKCGSDIFIRANPWRIEEYRDRDMRRSMTSRPFRMLITLPEVAPRPSPGVYYDMGLLIGHTRTFALQFHLDNGLVIGRAWPAERFDHEDHMFFVFGDPKWDYCSLNFHIDLSHRLMKNVTYECEFLAVGWSTSNQQDILCSIVDQNAHENALSVVRNQMESDPPREWFISSLAEARIPVQSSVVFPIPDSRLCARTSFRIHPIHNPQLCSGKFWSVSFNTEIGHFSSGQSSEDRSRRWDAR